MMEQLCDDLLVRIVPTREFRELIVGGIPRPFGADHLDLLTKLPLAALLGLAHAQEPRPVPARPTVVESALMKPGTREELSTLREIWVFLAKSSSLRDLEVRLKRLSAPNTLRLVGPSLSQLLKLSSAESQQLSSVLKHLRSLGLRELRAGPRTGYEMAALEQDLTITVSLDVSPLIDHLHLASGPKEAGEKAEDTALLLFRLGTEVIEIREEFEKFGDWRCDFSLSSEEARRLTLQVPFAISFTKAIAITRLLLPTSIPLEAPPIILGKHLSRLLFHLRIASPGIVALNTDTADELGVPLMSEMTGAAEVP